MSDTQLAALMKRVEDLLPNPGHLEALSKRLHVVADGCWSEDEIDSRILKVWASNLRELFLLTESMIPTNPGQPARG